MGVSGLLPRPKKKQKCDQNVGPKDDRKEWFERNFENVFEKECRWKNLKRKCVETCFGKNVRKACAENENGCSKE